MADDGRFRGRFQKGVDDPRRYRGGAQRGPKKAELKQRRAEDERAKQIAENDTTMPLDYLLRRMRNTDLLEHERFAAAVRAAPYCHAQLQAIAHKHLDASGNPDHKDSVLNPDGSKPLAKAK